jgi:hypothetical protein
MAEMYLTEKLFQKHLESSSASSMSETDDIVDEGSQSDMDDRHVDIYIYIYHHHHNFYLMNATV